MEIKKEIIKDITILTLIGNLLGENDSEPIKEIVIKAIEDDRSNFILDVKGMEYINSTGLSILISTLTKARKAKGDLCLVNVPEQLESLLKITKLDKIFPYCNSIEEAINKLT